MKILLGPVSHYIEKSIHFGKLSQVTLYGKLPGHEFEPEMELQRLYNEGMGFDSIRDVKKGPKAGNKLFFRPPNAFLLDSLTEYGSGFQKNLTSFSKEATILVVAKAKVYPFVVPCDALLVVSTETNEGKPVRWESALVDRVASAGMWNTVLHMMFLKGEECRGAKLKIYIWNKGKTNLLIDNMEYTVYRVGRHSPFEPEQFVWNMNDMVNN